LFLLYADIPASNLCQSKFVPSAVRTSTAESRISGPIPSPSMSVIGVFLIVMFLIRFVYL
tara:strand:+ start:2056 stop:2235 length:180 start_codon:yes stop_codon:yes gene_type:complete